MEILGTNEIGYKQPIQVDNNGHLIISGNTGGGSGGGSAVIPPTTTTGNISGVGAFAKTNGANTYSPLNLDATGHLLVSASGIENVVLVQGKDGANQYDVKVDGTGQVATTNAILDGCVVATVLATSNTYVDACVNDGGAHAASAVLTTTNPSITKGDGTIVAGGGLQQCLIYGKHSDGRLFPLESDGDRLRVNNGDLSIAAQQTTNVMPQAKGFQVYGTNGTNMRTIKTDDNGNLQVAVISGGGGGGGGETYTTNTTYLTGSDLNALGTTLHIDIGAVSVKEMKFFFDATSPFTDFYAVGSLDNADFYPIFPTNGVFGNEMYVPTTSSASNPIYNGAHVGSPRYWTQFILAHPPRYVLFKNNDTSIITGLTGKYITTSG